MPDKLGIVAVGYDSGHQTGYVKSLQRSPLYDVTAVSVDPAAPAESREKARQGAAAAGVPYVDDLATALGQPGVGAACICIAPERRVAVMEQIAAAGKHMLVDKPLALTLSDMDAMEAAARRHGVHVTPWHHYRYQEGFRSARQAILAGRIGMPWAIRAEFLVSTGTRTVPMGELHNFALYVLDAMRYVVGAEFTSVYCVKGSYFYDNARDLGVEDLAFIHGRMHNGIIAQCSVGRTPHQKHPNGYAGDHDMRISGTAGVLFVDTNRPRLRVHSEKGAYNAIFKTDTSYVIVDEFARAILAGRRPEVGIEDARQCLKVTLAAHRSAAENQVVQL